MSLASIAVAVAAVWLGVFLLLKITDVFFCPDIVKRALDAAGLRVLLGYVSWETTTLNAAIERTAQRRRYFFSWWFAIGVYVGIVLMIASVCILVANLFFYFTASTHDQGVDDLMLTPLVPGVNVHGLSLAYLFMALFVSAVFHELGHAFAAALYHQPIQSVGSFLFLVYPGAYVSFETDFEELDAYKKLQIYCAGVFHNIVLALFALLWCYLFGIVAMSLYTHDRGVVVRSIDEGFAGRLQRGDVITSIGDCDVRETDWTKCPFNYEVLEDVKRQYRALHGRCVNASDLKRERLSCCLQPEPSASSGCFVEDQRFACLDLKESFSKPRCDSVSDCSIGEVCAYHLADDVDTVVTELVVHDREHVLFQGGAWLLPYHMKLSRFVPRFAVAPIGLPDEAQQLAMFVASVSAALGLLNLAPALMLDGQHALASYIDFSCPQMPLQKRALWFRGVLYAGTALFVLNLFVSIFTLGK